MQISFSTAACPRLDLSTAATMGRRLGFAGVELPALRDAAIATSTNALLTAPDKIRRIFSAANVQISSLNVGGDLAELPERIALAAELDCPVIQLNGDRLFSSDSAIRQLQIGADTATMAQVTLLIETRPIAGSALALWHLLDRLNHPAIGCCWSIPAADMPAVAVPMLNTRICCLRLVNSESQTSGTLDRLRGIGFTGPLLVSPAESPTIEQYEQSLVKMLDALKARHIEPSRAA